MQGKVTRTAKKSGAISNLAEFGGGRTQKEVDDLKQGLAEALKDKQDLTKKLAEKERSVEELKFHLDEAQQFIDDMMNKEDPKKSLARPARSGAPSALSQPRSHAPSAQSEVDDLKQALAAALKDKQDLKTKLAETEVTKTKVEEHKSPAPPPSFSGPADDVQTRQEKEKSQKALGMPSLPPRAQLTMILDLDFASTGAEGMTMKMRLEFVHLICEDYCGADMFENVNRVRRAGEILPGLVGRSSCCHCSTVV